MCYTGCVLHKLCYRCWVKHKLCVTHVVCYTIVCYTYCVPFEARFFFLSKVQYQPAKAPASTSWNQDICKVHGESDSIQFGRHLPKASTKKMDKSIPKNITKYTCPKASTKKMPQNIPKRLSSWKADAMLVGPYLMLFRMRVGEIGRDILFLKSIGNFWQICGKI